MDDPERFAMVTHPIPPVFDAHARVLILGSFPSVRSRAVGFYYGHPQNRFWKMLARVLETPEPENTAEKKQFLLRHRIALWDVIGRCEITGSADASIREAMPNPIGTILAAADIRLIVCNGQTAFRLYTRLVEPVTGRPAVVLPSTSPANAAYRLDRLVADWGARLLPVLRS